MPYLRNDLTDNIITANEKNLTALLLSRSVGCHTYHATHTLQLSSTSHDDVREKRLDGLSMSEDRSGYRLVSLVVKTSTPRAEDLGSIPASAVDLFCRSSGTID